jgi:hypothetical protein
MNFHLKTKSQAENKIKLQTPTKSMPFQSRKEKKYSFKDK